jgi:nucleoside-diphosphate-sugar epimerase
MTDTTPPSASADIAPRETVLVTGFPAFTARRMIAELLTAGPAAERPARVFVLVRKQFEAAAAAALADLTDGGIEASVIIGDVCDMDLGLSGTEYRALAEEVTTIHHLAGIYFMGIDRATAERVNITGTRGVLDLARETRRLRRVIHWSTAFVSGRRKGVVLEEELDEGQAFNNFWEETKFEAEKLARAAQKTLPVTILRPGLIVGDSRNGEIDKFDGPYSLIFAATAGERALRLPLPARGAAPLHLVPIDFVIAAGRLLGLDAAAAGKTFHLTDCNPLPAHRVFSIVAELARMRPPPTVGVPPGIARTLMRAPGIARLTRAPRAVLDAFDHQCLYNNRHAVRLLARHGITCPPFDAYAEALVAYTQRVQKDQRRDLEDEVFDPFD